MARAVKAKPTLESIFFVTPEQKLMRFLLSEPTTTFTLRTLSSKLKGVRGLGGAEGMTRILKDLETLGLVQFMNNERSVCLQNESSAVEIMKIFGAVCDLEGLKELLEPLSSKGILFGSRSTGKARSDSNFDLFIVSENADEVRKVIERHPFGKVIDLTIWSQDDYLMIEKRDSDLAKKLHSGVVIWGSNW